MKRRTRVLVWTFLLALIALGGAVPFFLLHAPQILEEARLNAFSPRELAVLAKLANSTNAIRIGHIPDTPPIDFRDERQVRKGLTWDYVKLLEQKLDLHFELVDCTNWEEALESGAIDLVGSIQKTPDRTGRFDFSSPYWKIKMLILASKDTTEALSLETLGNRRVAVVENSAIHTDLENKLKTHPGKYHFVLVPVDNARQGMMQVGDGMVDALVADSAVTRYYMPTLGLDLRVAGETDYTWNLCFASRTNSPLPSTILDSALGMITAQEHRTIETQWPTLLNTSEFNRVLLMKIIGTILTLTLLAIGTFVFWNRTLRRQITNQLRELGRVRLSHDQTARALDESEARFRILVESSSDLIWDMDRYGCFTYVSPRVQTILGYTPAELTGKSSVSLLIPPDSARRMEQLHKYTADSTIDCDVSTYIHKDGRRVILESSGMAYTDKAGELAGFRGVSRDITERIASENALRLSEERFRNLVETTSDWIWEVDTQGRYTYLSPQSSALLGYAPDALSGRPLTTLMPENEARLIEKLFRQSLRTGEPVHSLVCTNRHRAGHTVMLEMSAVPFYDKVWDIKGFRGISRDITTRVAAEKQLEFQRGLFRSFMEHAPDLIYFKDGAGRFIEINNAKARELRRPTEEIIGKTDFDFLPADQARQKSEDEAEVMRTRKPLQKEETATTAAGLRWYLTTKVPRYDETGNVVGTFGTSWDITYRKQAEEQLRQLRALLSNVIDSMPSILIGVEAGGRIIQWNRQAESASGLPAAEALGRQLPDAFPELAGEISKVDRAIRDRKAQHDERVRFEKDRHVRYRDITVFPLEGETEGAVIRVDDITDRVMIEESIRNIVEGVAVVGRRFFGSMVSQLYKTLDADLAYISEYADESHTFMRTLAVYSEGSIEPNFEYAIASTPCNRVMANKRCTYVASVREQYPETEFLRQRKIEGYIGIPLVDSANKALGIMVAMYRKPIEQVEFASSIMQVFAGRTAAELERLQATKELVALRNLLENIINAMPSILIGVDAEGRIMQWNREAERISRVEAREAQGKPLSQVLPDLGPDLNLVFENLLIQGPQHHERIHGTILGDQRIVDVTVYPVTTDGTEGAVVRLDDVTDRVRIEDMMMQSEKMMSVGGLAAGMAHEINNPLAGILQNMQVIQNRILQETERNTTAAEEAGTSLKAIQAYMESRGLIRMLESTVEAGHRAANIVDNMLSFSRKSESHFAPHDLEEIVERSLQLASNDYNLKKRFDFRHINIIREFDKLEPVECESGQLQQVLLNLMSNAAQAMADHHTDGLPDPVIRLRLKREKDMALIEVADNGPGMDDETRKRAFEPFFTTKEVGQGTGLGLSISYFIITENHGGSMLLDSVPGRGTRFSIRIPFEHRTALWGLRL